MAKKRVVKESTVVKNIFKELRRNFAGFYFKTHGSMFQKAGIPDILGCHKGYFIAIEVKSPSKEDTLTDIQKNVIKQINRAGGIAFMATSANQVREELEIELSKKSVSKNSKRRKKVRSDVQRFVNK